MGWPWVVLGVFVLLALLIGLSMVISAVRDIKIARYSGLDPRSEREQAKLRHPAGGKADS